MSTEHDLSWAHVRQAQFNAVCAGVFHASPDFNPQAGDPRVAYASLAFWQN